jgi:hypothetical protein
LHAETPKPDVHSISDLEKQFSHQKYAIHLVLRSSEKLDYSRLKSRLKNECWAVNAHQLLFLREINLLQCLPPISARDIEALDKGSGLVKLLAILQVCWLIIQLLVRTLRKLPSSQLEIAVLAFSVSSLITYIILWDRPRSINRRVRIAANRFPSLDEIQSFARCGPDYTWTGFRGEDKLDREYLVAPIPNDAIHDFGVSRTLYLFTTPGGAIFGGVVFGSLHCLAWNFHFPTPIEASLWRICSVLTTALPILFAHASYLWATAPMGIFTFDMIRSVKGKSRLTLIAAYIIVLITAYILARLFIIIETFRSLFYLPPEAFKDTWSSSFPHWG